ELLLEAGLPPLAIQCLTGPGGPLGDALCQDKRVRKITFTGSREVGDRIIRHAGIKKVTLELGSNCPVIVLPDADLEKTVKSVVAGGYGNAGQTCISAQRIIALSPVYGDFLDALKPAVAALKTGDPLAEGTQMGPLVSRKDAERVEKWISEAKSSGGEVVVGGGRDGATHQPTVVADAPLDSKIWRDELFGPAVAVVRASSVEEAIRLASDTDYGLGASIYTENLPAALKFIREVPSGNLHINGGPSWRVDLMPYGGLKDSGLGKEGPKYAVEAMTELKMVVIHE
ncbi:MAG TPA: aldehyde dehydrogenase family protein, partial [Pirellulales bacterium]